MVLLYNYFDLLIYFEGDKQLPIRIFGKRNKEISIKIIKFKNGLIDEIRDKNTELPLDPNDQKIFDKLVEDNISEIIKSWIDIFVYNKEKKPEQIMNRLQIKNN